MILQDMTQEAMIAKIAALEAQIARQKANSQRRLGIKVGKSGTVHVTGINGKYGVALYRQQWEQLLTIAPDISQFILDNADLLSVKE